MAKEKTKSKEFTIDIMNPIHQVIGIAIVGFLISVIFEPWIKWIAWIIGMIIWYYVNYVYKSKTGAVNYDKQSWFEKRRLKQDIKRANKRYITEQKIRSAQNEENKQL